MRSILVRYWLGSWRVTIGEGAAGLVATGGCGSYGCRGDHLRKELGR